MKRPLTVIDASAGSGKTYTLVKEYIKLAIGENKEGDFRKILAMTFTNKAAWGMKERIIQQLCQLSLEKDINLAQKVADDLKINVKEIKIKSQEILHQILHQYENFNLSTMDKFNLRLIRIFSQDLDIPDEFEVLMNGNEVIEMVVDKLLSYLGEDQELNKIILKFSERQLNEDKSWRIRKELVKFGKIILNEKNKTYLDYLLENIDQWNDDRRKKIYQQMESIEQQIQKLAQKVKDEAEEWEKLPNKSKTTNPIQKIIDSPKEFPNTGLMTIKKKIENGDFSSFPKFSEAFLRLFRFVEEKKESYSARKSFLDNYFQLVLLKDIQEKYEELKYEDRFLFISEFNTLISSLIQGEKAPYIYERLGNRYDHFLLDEFQDTSRTQWLNLIPLIYEGISKGKKSLIVGDPKQSIYRFNDALPEQFSALPRLYQPDNEELKRISDYFNTMGEKIPLENNWRSTPVIVHFNNAFFQKVRENILHEEQKDFYENIVQRPQKQINGYIHIISKEKNKDKEELFEERIEQIMQWIEEAKTDGFDYGDICLLGFKNDNVNQWVLALTENGYKVVSVESLLLDKDVHVRLVFAYLNWRVKASEANKRKFIRLYLEEKGLSFNDYQSYVEDKESKTSNKINVERFLDDFFEGKDFFFKYEGLYHLLQDFYRIMEYDETQNPYLHRLSDYIFEYEQKFGPNLKGLIEHYENNKDHIAVQIPESKDTIKAMTFHKSKGLEFPVVILPDISSKLDDIKNGFFAHYKDEEEFLLYEKPKKDSLLSAYQKIRKKELAQIITDKVNTLYVGMTRPSERLYIFNAYDSSKNDISSHFHDLFAQNEHSKEISNGIEIIEGKRSRSTQNKKVVDNSCMSSEKEIFIPKNISDCLWYPEIALRNRDSLTSESKLNEDAVFGKQFHLLVSKIEQEDQIDTEIEKGIAQGEINVEFREKIKEKIQDLMRSETYRQLFQNSIEIINEQEIIAGEEELVIPDKIILKKNETIIIDYKTGINRNKHIDQILNYKNILEKMGFPNVKCFLYYSINNHLQEVS